MIDGGPKHLRLVIQPIRQSGFKRSRIEYTKASKWPVLDKDGTHVGDIIRQRGSTLWSLQRKGMDRPFKRGIRSLEQAKALAVAYPLVWGGPNFDLRRSLIHTAVWCAILAGLFALLLRL